MKVPSSLTLNKSKTQLSVIFDGSGYNLSAEYLRVHSPSAEVRGHSPDQAVLQVGKEKVTISQIEPVGNYAVKFKFSDSHDTGIYSWDLLYDLSVNYTIYWENYIKRLAAAGHQRNAD